MSWIFALYLRKAQFFIDLLDRYTGATQENKCTQEIIGQGDHMSPFYMICLGF